MARRITLHSPRMAAHCHWHGVISQAGRRRCSAGKRETSQADRYLTQNQQKSTPVGWPPDRVQSVYKRAPEAVKGLAFDGVADTANS